MVDAFIDYFAVSPDQPRDVTEGIVTVRAQALARIALVTGLLLLLPFLAMLFTDEIVWDLADFVVAGLLVLGAGLVYEYIAKKAAGHAYLAAAGIAIVTAFLLVWMNLAVGIIGNEGNPANLIYMGVLAVGITGSLVARFRPAGMARALFATVLAQAAITAIVLVAGLDSAVSSVLILNGFFVMLFAGSALLFRRTARESD